MPLTPIEIKKKEFSRALRGCDPREVSSFLEIVAQEMDRLAANLREEQQRTADCEARLTQYTSLERNIQQALVQAQESAAKTMESINREAGVKLRETELEAQRLLDTARRDADKILGQAHNDISQFNDEIASLRAMRGTLLARIKSFLSQQAQALRELEHEDRPAPGQTSGTMFNVSIDDILKSLE